MPSVGWGHIHISPVTGATPHSAALQHTPLQTHSILTLSTSSTLQVQHSTYAQTSLHWWCQDYQQLFTQHICIFCQLPHIEVHYKSDHIDPSVVHLQHLTNSPCQQQWRWRPGSTLLLWLLRAQLCLVTVTTSHHQQPPVTPPPAPGTQPAHHCTNPLPLEPPGHLLLAPGSPVCPRLWLVVLVLAGAHRAAGRGGVGDTGSRPRHCLSADWSSEQRPPPPPRHHAVAAHRRQGRCSEAAATPAQPPAHTFYIVSGTQYVMW